MPACQGRALKAQRNGGYGACFPWHYDNPGRPNQRAITCVLYLNPHWQVRPSARAGMEVVSK